MSPQLGGGPAPVHQLLEVPLPMGPTDLPLRHGPSILDCIAVTAHDPRDDFAQ